MASDETKVSVSVGANASNGTHSVSVEQTASSAYLTGDNIKIKGNSYTRYNDAGLATKFADMTDASGQNLSLAGQKISISDGTNTVEYELGGTGTDGVASLSELNEKLAREETSKACLQALRTES